MYDFFDTGVYDRNREFVLTSSPSMDILISSNLERLIYRIAGEDAAKTKEMMDALSADGKYTLTEEMKAQLADFVGGWASRRRQQQKSSVCMMRQDMLWIHIPRLHPLYIKNTRTAPEMRPRQ